MLYELKLEYEEKDKLDSLIKKAYFNKKNLGKLSKSSSNYLTISNDTSLFLILKNMNNMTVKIFNHDIILGNLRMLITETKDTIKLFPCSIYCIIEDGKYSFF